MASSLNLPLTDELRAFIDENCDDGTLDASPSDFVNDIPRQCKARLELTRRGMTDLEGIIDFSRVSLANFQQTDASTR